MFGVLLFYLPMPPCEIFFCQVEIAIRDNAQRLYASRLNAVGRGKYIMRLIILAFSDD